MPKPTVHARQEHMRPAELQAEQIKVREGAFKVGDEVVKQVDASAIGPNAHGFVVIDVTYLQAKQPIAQKGLASLVVGAKVTDFLASFKPLEVRFSAVYVPSSEPMLIDAVMLQVGEHAVTRAKAVAPVQRTESRCIGMKCSARGKSSSVPHCIHPREAKRH